ncbi:MULTISPECIES: FAD/NAD(P)-binding protein [Myxococcus]|uniref:FAD/NAD(P)-binding protein n=1 Tax=Myxococcus TaxID=32 RepID=UPI0013D7AE1B|nr:FAD/NAD(P)-binding protein [Myxococcus eversor]NVJ21190.1 FAD/NAD(P)-binding protein [Myxococcus sp. AM011]
MRVQSSPWDVAVVGGGASGTLLAIHLLRQARAPFRILLVERGGQVGQGLAYSTRSQRHLLNVPAARMGAFAEEPEHFLRWLRQQTPDTEGGDFVPRLRYGQYLDSVLKESIARAPPGVQLETQSGEVTSTREHGGLVTLTTRGGVELVARAAVLALGNASPADLRVADGGLYTSPRYHRSPWAPGALDGIGEDDTVLLIGTGLTMVDAVLSLEERGHRGALHALSRHGLLPHRHPRTVLQGTYASPGIRDVLRALRDTGLRDDGLPALEQPHPIPVRVRALLRVLRHEVRRATDAGASWRAVMDALRPVTVPLWQRLDIGERRRFLRHLRAYWDVHRHRMAPDVADGLERLRTQGRLALHAARVRSFHPDDAGTVRVRVRRRGERREEDLQVHHVVNCTGPEGDVTRHGHPLLHRLAEEGRVRPDALGLGLDTDRHGALLDANGHAGGRLFTLGPLRRGELWETTAVPEIRTQARALSEHLLKRLGRGFIAPRRSAG